MSKLFTGSVIDIDAALPEPQNRRRYIKLANAVENYQAAHDGSVGLPREAIKAAVEVSADPDQAAVAFDENRFEKRSSQYGPFAYARSVIAYVWALLPFIVQPRTSDSRFAPTARSLVAGIAEWPEVRGAVDEDGNPYAHLTFRVSSPAALVEALAEISSATADANPDMEQVTVEAGATAMDPVDLVLVEVIVESRTVDVTVDGKVTSVVVPEQRVLYLMTFDGNSRTIWRRVHMEGLKNPKLIHFRKHIEEWLTHEKMTDVELPDGSTARVPVPVLKTTRDLTNEARARIEDLLSYQEVHDLEGGRFDFSDELKRKVASQVIRANVIHTWHPAPELKGEEDPEVVAAALDEVSRVTHAQVPHPNTSTNINILRTALNLADDDVMPRKDRALAAGHNAITMTDGEVVDSAQLLAERFPDDSPQMRLLRVIALLVRFISAPGGRRAIRAVGNIRQLRYARAGSILGSGVAYHLEPSNQAWSSTFRLSGGMPYSVFKQPALPLSTLKGSDFTVSARPVGDILEQALEELSVQPVRDLSERPAACELVALGVAPLAFSGALRPPGTSRVAEPRKIVTHGHWNVAAKDEHGTKVPVDADPQTIMTALASRETGLRQLALSIEQFERALKPGNNPKKVMTAVDPATGVDTTDDLDPARLICVALPVEVAQAVAKAKKQVNGGGSGNGDGGDDDDAATRLHRAIVGISMALNELDNHSEAAVKEVTAHSEIDAITTIQEGMRLKRHFADLQMDVAGRLTTLHDRLEALGAVHAAPSVDEDDLDDIDLGEHVE